MSEGSCNLKKSFKSQNLEDAQLGGKNVSATMGFLIVETNFRVFAYTNSDLQIAILSTFSELNCRFENVSIGLITRESVRRALQVN